MLAKKNRLSKNMEIKKVLSKGRAFFNSFYTLKFLVGQEVNVGRVRFTVVVSTKVSKLAVRRNRIKRIIRETFKLFSQRLPFGDYVLICKIQSGNAEKSELLQQLENLLKKLIVNE